MATGFVGLLHTLQLGAATVEGKVAAGLAALPLEGEMAQAKEALASKATDPEALVKFYVTAVMQRVQTASAKQGKPSPAKPAVGITFSPSPEREQSPDPEQKQLVKKAQRMLKTLQKFDVQQEDARTVLKTWVEAFNVVAATLQESSPALYAAVVGDGVDEQVKELKAQIPKPKDKEQKKPVPPAKGPRARSALGSEPAAHRGVHSLTMALATQLHGERQGRAKPL